MSEEIKKQWKERENLSISELEDLWFANRNLEMARSIILAIKDFQKITLEEKLEFLHRIIDEKSNLHRTGYFEKIYLYIRVPILEVMLYLLPEWKQEPTNKNGRPYAESILFLLFSKFSYPLLSVGILTSQIKKFIHSYLNSVKKEEMFNECLVAQAFINNKMLEELVNYNFISAEAVEELWGFVFKQNSMSATDFRVFFLEAHTVRKERIEEIRKALCSWDKVENRHALATLWTLLAKRGDLEKIFGKAE